MRLNRQQTEMGMPSSVRLGSVSWAAKPWHPKPTPIPENTDPRKPEMQALCIQIGLQDRSLQGIPSNNASRETAGLLNVATFGPSMFFRLSEAVFGMSHSICS